MVELNNISEIFQIASEVTGAIIGVGGCVYKFIIAPEKKFKVETSQKITDLISEFNIHRKHNEEQFRELKGDLNDKINDLSRNLKDSTKDEQKDLHYLREEIKEVSKEINDHIERVETKNEKLLDLIIKYFTDKN